MAAASALRPVTAPPVDGPSKLGGVVGLLQADRINAADTRKHSSLGPLRMLRTSV